MRVLVVVLSLAVSSFAYNITSPNENSVWSSTGSNTLSWQRVDTDPETFAVVLTNEDRSVLPDNDQLLESSVDGTTGSITIDAPSGGFPTGSGFRVNLIKDQDDPSTIFAQSNEFEISNSGSSSSTSSSGSSSSSSSRSSSSTGTSSTRTTLTASQTGTSPTTSSSLNPTTSNTSNGAAFSYGANAWSIGLLALIVPLLA